MADTTSTRLLEPLLDTQDRHPHFFNGRILTAADLRDARDAQRRDTARLGRALGAGVVSGFEVLIDFAGTVGDPPRLTIFGGLAVNRRGQSLTLARERLTLRLGDPATPAPNDAGLFADCCQDRQGAAGGAATSILVVYPTSEFGAEKVALRAPLRGQSGDGASTGCGARYVLSGVAFREVALPEASTGSFGELTPAIAPLLQLPSPQAKDLAMLRNLLAHACFGLSDPAAADDPWLRLPGTPPRAGDAHGLLDLLRDSGEAGGLDDCAVPLALIQRTGASLAFVDMWSVRRRPSTPFAGEPWPGLLADRRASESEAALLQFQEQLEALRPTPGNQAEVKAQEHFRFLPATGLLPVGGGGFSPKTFFGSLSYREEDVDPAFLRLLFAQARHLDPVDLNAETAFRVLRPLGIDAYRVFVRDEWRPATTPSTPSTPTTTPDGEPKPTSGSLRIVLRVDAKAITALLKEYKITAGQKQLPDNALTVEVRDSAKRPYTPQRRQNKGVSGAGKGAVDFANGSVELFCDDLPPDTYTVTVKGKVIASASQSKAVRSGEETRFDFVLTARQTPSGPVKPGTRPSRDTPAGWLKERPLERLWLMDRFLGWPWPPEPEWSKQEWVTDPPPEDFRDWTALWGEVLQSEYPDAPIDAGRAQLVFDPAYEPGATSADPYAYIVFGDSGAYAPLVATTADHDLAGAVGAGRAGVPGIDAEASSRLAAQGFDRVDILANAWIGGVVGALGASRGVARALVSSARLRSAALKDSALQIPGIDAKAAQAFKDAGITLDMLAKAPTAGGLDAVVDALKGIGYDDAAATTYANAYAESAVAMQRTRR